MMPHCKIPPLASGSQGIGVVGMVGTVGMGGKVLLGPRFAHLKNECAGQYTRPRCHRPQWHLHIHGTAQSNRSGLT